MLAIPNKGGSDTQPYEHLDSVLHGNKGVIIIIDRMKRELADVISSISKLGPVKVVEFRSYKNNGDEVYTFEHVDMKKLS